MFWSLLYGRFTLIHLMWFGVFDLINEASQNTSVTFINYKCNSDGNHAVEPIKKMVSLKTLFSAKCPHTYFLTTWDALVFSSLTAQSPKWINSLVGDDDHHHCCRSPHKVFNLEMFYIQKVYCSVVLLKTASFPWYVFPQWSFFLCFINLRFNTLVS